MDASVLHKNTHHNGNSYSGLYLLFALSGLSFLFFLGFPFGNHNESYVWLLLLEKMSFWESLTSRLGPVQSFRPLGTATAWLTYTISGGIYLQQLVNWAFACLSFIVVFRQATNKPFFSIAAFLASTGFFAGYIYLFHLHGVFYGPLQLYIAVLSCAAYKHKNVSFKTLAFLFLITIIAAFYHTFALLVFSGYLAGCMLQVPRNELRTRLPLLFVFMALSLFIMYVILSMYESKNDGDVLYGTLTSFTTTELNLPLSLLSSLFAIITVFTSNVAIKYKQVYLLVSLIAAAICIYLHIPVLLLWILACIIKMMLSKNWALTAIIFSTAVFPVATHTGTPTYIVFVIMVCVFAMSMDNRLFVSGLPLARVGIPAFLSLLILLLVCCKRDIKLPFIGKGLNPILAEQEKTHQLESILSWQKSSSTYATKEMRFLDESAKPSASATAINRKFRPPTQQRYLDRYINEKRTLPFDSAAVPLVITFGSKEINGRQPVFKVTGFWNGNAYVY